MGDVVDVHRDEAVVLEPAEDPEQHADRDRHGDAPAALVACRRHPGCPGEGHDGGGQQQEAVAPPDPAVEHVAQRDHGELPPPRVGVEQPVHRVRDGEEDCEVDGGKEHRRDQEGAPNVPPVAPSEHARGARESPVWPRHGRLNVTHHSASIAGPPPNLGGRAVSGPPPRPSVAEAQLLALSASINAGRTLCTSPTIPRSATEKMGASWSLLIATMFFEPFMPTRCCVAPEIPHAM